MHFFLFLFFFKSQKTRREQSKPSFSKSFFPNLKKFIIWIPSNAKMQLHYSYISNHLAFNIINQGFHTIHLNIMLRLKKRKQRHEFNVENLVKGRKNYELTTNEEKSTNINELSLYGFIFEASIDLFKHQERCRWVIKKVMKILISL